MGKYPRGIWVFAGEAHLHSIIGCSAGAGVTNCRRALFCREGEDPDWPTGWMPACNCRAFNSGWTSPRVPLAATMILQAEGPQSRRPGLLQPKRFFLFEGVSKQLIIRQARCFLIIWQMLWCSHNYSARSHRSVSLMSSCLLPFRLSPQCSLTMLVCSACVARW